MMGMQNKEPELFSYQVNLEKRVRADHPLRAILAQVDFTWVREDVAHHYGRNGNESVDPVVILKLLLLLFMDHVKSERELMRVVPERLDYLWFLGYGLDDKLPDHSVLSKARARWGRETFERFFVRTVGQCVQLGLVDGKKIHVDSSRVQANASVDSFRQPGPELSAALRAAFASEESKFEASEQVSRSKAKSRVSTTDPDATLSARDGGRAMPSYKSHRVVDDKRGVITAVETTPGHIHDGMCLLDLTEQHHRTSGVAAGTVVGDQHYGTHHNIRQLQSQGVRTHLKPSGSSGSAQCRGVFPASDFVYDPRRDTYRCPNGKELHRCHRDAKRNRTIFRADRATCNACPLRSQCTTGTGVRTIKHPDGYELLQRGWLQAASAEGRRDLRRRMTLIEGSFGQAAQNHHFKRARWRLLWRQQIQDHLIAAVQNIKKLVQHARKGPAGSFLSPLRALRALHVMLCELVLTLPPFSNLTKLPAPK